jgi:hypothetical protein
LLAGAPQYDNAGADRGAVYWFNVTNPASPQQLSRTLIPGTDASDFCGISVKLHQGFGIVGCPGMNANVGRVVVLDARAGVAGATVSKTLSATGVSSFGIDVDASDGLIAATDLGGTIALFDLSGSSTTSLREFPVPGFVQASSLALSGNTLLLGNQSDAAQGSAAGAGIVLRNLTRPLPLQKVTAKGDFAPGAPETGFASFSDVRLSDDGSLAIAGGLSGPGSGGGKDTGVWETLGGSSLTLASKSRNVVGGSTLSAVGAPLMKASFTLAVPATTIPGTVIYRAKLDGTKPALLRDNGTSVAVAFAAGQAVDGSELLSLGAAAVPTLDNSLAFAGKFKLSGATTAANDSALIWHRFSHPSVPPIASATETIREGDASGFSAEPGEASPPTIGEIALPMALTGTRLFSIHQLTGPADKNQGLIGRSSISGALEALFRKGVSHPPNATGAAQASLLFGSFLGVSSDPLNRFMFRAQLTGDGVTAANNEGLWGASGGSVKQIIRKGDLLPGSATASISGFKAFWVANGQFMVWVTLKGTGVTAANDQAVVLFQTSAPVADVPVVLLREGDFAPGLSPAKIGTIQQIEVDGMQGQYLILAGLTGAPGKDLALFRGHSKAPLGSASEQPIRLPYPILRKGIWFDDQPSKLKSFSLPTNTRGTSGAGNIGLGTVLQATAPSTSSRIVSLLTFENGVTQAGAGAP